MPAHMTKSVSPLPSVDAVLGDPVMLVARARFGRMATTTAVRDALSALRTQQTNRPASFVSDAVVPEAVAGNALRLLEAQDKPSLRPVFNLTGTVLHTNLGRAVMPECAIEAVAAVMRQAVNLEYDIQSGKRGERDDHVRDLVCELTGAEDCVIVNNNAAAVLLALASLSNGRETIVSRGELVEIGGSFRIPDIMRRAGARLREVGTTNRTHASDYHEAITARTAAIMKVHTSNYRVEGFTADVSPSALASIAHGHGLPFIDDLGSGTLVDLARYGMKPERTVQDAIKDGADLVTFSGDKLLGGPQVGIIAGRKDAVRLCARNPFKRALRVDKMRLAALAATLKLYRDPDSLPQHLPTLRAFIRQPDALRAMAEVVVPRLQAMLGQDWLVSMVDLMSQIGSGALPLETLASHGVAISPNKRVSGRALDGLARRFRNLPVPVIGRIHQGQLLFDLRCLDDVSAFLEQLVHWPETTLRVDV